MTCSTACAGRRTCEHCHANPARRADKGGMAFRSGNSLAISAPAGEAELVVDAQHFSRIVRDGICAARTSVDILTADFKAMLVPEVGTSRGARSIVEIFRRLADKGVEIRLLHAGTPSSPALRELKA